VTKDRWPPKPHFEFRIADFKSEIRNLKSEMKLSEIRNEDMPATALTPSDLAHFITEAGIAAELVPMALETPTVPAAAAALGVAPAQIVKSLLFLIRGEPVLVIASGDALVDRRPLADHFGCGRKQVKLADAQTVLEITGYWVGGVPPFGHLTRVQTLMDRAVLAWDVVYGGGGDDRTLLRITPEELARVTGAEWL
jgi:prolyl-tRNA editing enzyme YbaK/EbsC (Cys-tRNA(Pro) deacylase)